MHLAPTKGRFAENNISVHCYLLQNLDNSGFLLNISKDIFILSAPGINAICCTVKQMLRTILLVTDGTRKVWIILISEVGFTRVCSCSKFKQQLLFIRPADL